MVSSEVREKYLRFFKSPPRLHKEVQPAPLVLKEDPTTLFTSSGMQPLVKFFLGEPHPLGKRLTNSQPCLRTQDILEVGDNRHTTFFEMLGNWSFGDYFKEEQIAWIWEFFSKEICLPKERIWVSIFKGGGKIPKDFESEKIWLSLGIPKQRIFEYGFDKNWWSRTGKPEEMAIGDIGGPDSEVFFEFENVKHNPRFGKFCHPNCGCGRFLEIGNSVFIQYQKTGQNEFKELPQKNVDFGGGLERIAAAVRENADIFTIDLIFPLIRLLQEKFSKPYSEEKYKPMLRIIADHMRASIFLIDNDILPSNKAHGYVLRRLLRRALITATKFSEKDTLELLESLDLSFLVGSVKRTYAKTLFSIRKEKLIKKVIMEEERKLVSTLRNSYQKMLKVISQSKGTISGKEAFDLFQSHGVFPDILASLAEKYGKKLDWEGFKKMQEKHIQKSKTSQVGIFKGGLADNQPETIKLHTATHLLLASLRKVLGDHVFQKGQNITHKRSRFDFSHQQKLTKQEVKKVEDEINKAIRMALPVRYLILEREQAEKLGAIHSFDERYQNKVKVYYIGKSLEKAFSKEFCGGPHVQNTKEIGSVKIVKQEKIGDQVIRIYLEINQK